MKGNFYNMKILIKGIRSNNFTAKLIHLGEKLRSWKNKEPYQKCYNHWEISYTDNGIEYTSGSRSDGTTTIKWQDYLNKYNKHIEDIYEFELEISNSQFNKLKQYLLQVEGRKYEHFMFLWYTVKLVFGTWFGSRSDNKLYCVEHVVRGLNKIYNTKLDTTVWPNELFNILKYKIKNEQ